MVDYILILWLCSTITGKCIDSHIPGYQFKSHYDCVYNGYALAQRSLKFLSEDEEWSRDRINTEKIVIKFECKELDRKIIIPPKKPKIAT
tara:strand:- start:815 stop:1084 length:270 start_codon:yes stop_codon:yes gene_type:complete